MTKQRLTEGEKTWCWLRGGCGIKTSFPILSLALPLSLRMPQMLNVLHKSFFLVLLALALSIAIPFRSGAQIAPADDCGGRVAKWNFVGARLSPAQRTKFKDAFCNEITNITSWADKNNWPVPSSPPPLQVFVSEKYQLARSLVLAWAGKPGQMQFPATRAAKGEADIAHELGHVYFPNGNRMLAEALGVYLQDDHGVNPGYPNFGMKVHEMMRCRLKADDRNKIDLSKLDQIATPRRLTIESDRIPPPAKEAWAYIVSASFARYLIDRYGMDKFYALYARTPFRPGLRVARQSGQWTDTYQLSLPDLEKNWKAMIEGINCPSSPSDAAGLSTNPRQ